MEMLLLPRPALRLNTPCLSSMSIWTYTQFQKVHLFTKVYQACVLRSWVCCKDFIYLYLGFLVFKASKQIKKKICKNWTKYLISPHLVHFHCLTAPETVYVYTQQVPSLKCNTGPPSVFLRAGRTAQTLVPYPRSSNCSTLFLMVDVILNAAE